MNPNPRYVTLLSALKRERDRFQAQGNHSVASRYRQACASLSRFPIPITSGIQCSNLRGFGPQGCNEINRYIEADHKLPNNPRKDLEYVEEVLLMIDFQLEGYSKSTSTDLTSLPEDSVSENISKSKRRLLRGSSGVVSPLARKQHPFRIRDR